MTSDLLKGKVISAAGIPVDRGLVLTHAALRERITNAGGEWSATITPRCTHLIATPKEYGKKNKKVQQAEKIQGLKIVDPQWLFTSLDQGKLEDEDRYLCSGSIANANGKRPGSPVADDAVATKAQKQSDDSSKGGQTGANAAPKKIPADPASPFHATHTVHVSEDGTIYDASLNLSHASGNSNKFYLLQVLENTGSGADFVLWQKWGRVGEKGQSKHIPFGDDCKQASKKFEQVFRSKTSLKWQDRSEPPKPGSYFYVEKSYEESDDEGNGGGQGDEGAKGKNKKKESKTQDLSELEGPKSQLHPHVQFLVNLILDQSYFQDTMASMSYDANKLPLRKLSKRTLLQGFELLKQLADLIAHEPDPTRRAQQSAFLSNQYFTIIPHVFGRRAPPTIAYLDNVKRETELLESLSEMGIAAEIMKIAGRGVANQNEHILDLKFKALNLDELTSLDPASREYAEVHGYLEGSSGSTHGIRYKPQHIFRVSRAGEEERYNTSPYAGRPDSHRLLLWHGSRATNYGGILSQGLRIAPPEAPSTGYTFGKGVYLADCSSKSANYCHSHLSGSMAILMLCDVDVGPVPLFEPMVVDTATDQACAAAGKTTTLGKGDTVPRKWKDAGCVNESLRGVWMPDYDPETGGGFEQTPRWNQSYRLVYNEYIAYDVRQIRVRYLVCTKIGR